MEIRVEAWGDDLALRIPSQLAAQIGLELGLAVNATSRGDELVVSVPKRPRGRLESVVEGITEDNLHREADFGRAVGRESW